MKVVLLGAVRRLDQNRWKNDLEEGGRALGWDVVHVNAHGIPADEVVRLCRGADAMIWARTHRHTPDGDVAGMLRRVEDAGTATVAVHMDLYWGIPRREAEVGADPWWSCQHVFTADGGPRDWAGRGVNHHWLPPAMGPRFLGRGRPDRNFPRRIVFVGSNVPHIHGPHRMQLLVWARTRYRGQFCQYRTVWGRHLSNLYASAEVVLGDSAPADFYWSDRVPISLGRGALLAHPHTRGFDELGFTDEVMIRYDRFGFDELGERIDSLTAADRRTMTDNALTLVAERHMWQNRLLEIERVVFGCGSSSPAPGLAPSGATISASPTI